MTSTTRDMIRNSLLVSYLVRQIGQPHATRLLRLLLFRVDVPPARRGSLV